MQISTRCLDTVGERHIIIARGLGVKKAKKLVRTNFREKSARGRSSREADKSLPYTTELLI